MPLPPRRADLLDCLLPFVVMYLLANVLAAYLPTCRRLAPDLLPPLLRQAPQLRAYHLHRRPTSPVFTASRRWNSCGSGPRSTEAPSRSRSRCCGSCATGRLLWKLAEGLKILGPGSPKKLVALLTQRGRGTQGRPAIFSKSWRLWKHASRTRKHPRPSTISTSTRTMLKP